MQYSDAQLEYVYDQLDEIGFDIESCNVIVNLKGSGRVADVVIEIPSDQYEESAAFLDNYLSEMSSDFSYTFPDVAARYTVKCFGESTVADDDQRDPLVDSLAEIEYYSDDEFDEDDADAQYRDEGLDIVDVDSMDSGDSVFSITEEDDEDDW